MDTLETQLTKTQQRVEALEEMLHEIIKGRVRTDMLFHQLEQAGYVPDGTNELADRLVESFEQRYQEELATQHLSNEKVIPLTFGRRLKEMREHILENEQEIYDLARSFNEWGTMYKREERKTPLFETLNTLED